MGIAVQLPDEFRKNMEQRFGLKVPKRPGLDTVRTIRAMHAGEVKVLVALGGHFLGASPDTEFTRQALTRCELTVHISTKLNRSHFAAGKCALILPCLGRTERDIPHLRPEFVTVENSMGIIHASRGTRPPHSPSLRGEPRIIAEIAERLLSEGALPFGTKPRGVSFSQLSRDYGAIRRLIEEVVPKMSGYDARVAEPGGFELENGPRERHFPTPQGRAQLTADPLLRAEPQAGELLLMTLRSHDQFNTTVYSDNDRYRGVSESRRVLLMHPEDLGTRGLSSGDLIDVESRYTSSDGREQSRRVTGFSALSYGVPRGSAAAYFPEANPLVILDSVASRSNTPTSKSIRIVVQKSLNSHSASSTKR